MTGFTGYTGVSNDNTFAPPADITAVYAHFDPLIGETVATAADLPASGNWTGRSIFVADQGRVLVWSGSAWIIPSSKVAGISVLAGSQLLTATAATITGLSSTVVLTAVPVRVKATIQFENTNSGADRYALAQLWDGTTAIGAEREILAPYAASVGLITPLMLIYSFTPTAGSHTFTVKARATVASAVTVRDCDLEITVL